MVIRKKARSGCTLLAGVRVNFYPPKLQRRRVKYNLAKTAYQVTQTPTWAKARVGKKTKLCF